MSNDGKVCIFLMFLAIIWGGAEPLVNLYVWVIGMGILLICGGVIAFRMLYREVTK